MPSIIWGRDPKEAYQNPYEYDAQAQFVREAKSILDGLLSELNRYCMKFKRDEVSSQKAIWMLQIDAVDSLRDCLMLLQQKKHRVAGRLFRDVVETSDLAAYFFSGTRESKKHLDKWYKDEIIPNSVYRDFIKKNEGKEQANSKKDHYRMLSKINHRTYRTLAYAYILGRDDLLAYEGSSKSDLLVPPQSIAMYYAILADFVILISDEIVRCGLIKKNDIARIWKDSLELETVPRRFVPSRFEPNP